MAVWCKRKIIVTFLLLAQIICTISDKDITTQKPSKLGVLSSADNTVDNIDLGKPRNATQPLDDVTDRKDYSSDEITSGIIPSHHGVNSTTQKHAETSSHNWVHTQLSSSLLSSSSSSSSSWLSSSSGKDSSLTFPKVLPNFGKVIHQSDDKGIVTFSPEVDLNPGFDDQLLDSKNNQPPLLSGLEISEQPHKLLERKFDLSNLFNVTVENPNLGNETQSPRTARFFSHYPFADLDGYQRKLWLEHMNKGRGSLSVEGTFLWTFGMIGSVANGAVFVTSAISKYFRKPLHIMVSSLALLDLYVTFIYIPSYTYFLVERNRDLDDNKKWSESAFSYCNVSRGLFIFNASLSITIQIFIALYLFVMTCSKDLVGKLFSIKNTILFICGACVGNSILLFTPTLFGYGRVDFYPNGHLCSPLTHEVVGQWRINNFRVLYHCGALTIHIAELLLICFFVVNIFLAVVRGKLVRIKYGRRDRMANMNYSRAIHLTVVVFSSFMLFWFPLYIINFADPNHDLIPGALHRLVFDLLLLKSCFNPLIYIYAIKTLRFELRLLCMCKCTPEERRKALTPPKKTTTSFQGESDIQTSSYGF